MAGPVNPLVPNQTINKQVSNATPAPIASLDVASGIAHDVGACKYTAITTSGTTTVNGNPCVYYQSLCVVLATATGAITVLDGTNTLQPTVTQTAIGTPTGWPGAAPLGTRCLTSLVVITAGTAANTWNILWD